MASTSISLIIPASASPSIQTDLVCFQWIIRFEFVTSSNSFSNNSSKETIFDEDGIVSIKDPMTFQWTVPIKIDVPVVDDNNNLPESMYTGISKIVHVF